METTHQEVVMKVKGSRRIVRRLGLALAVAAVVAPSAQAVRPVGDSGSLVGLQGTRYADDLHASLPRSPVVVESRRYAPINPRARPDLQPIADGPRHYAPINTLARPDLAPPSSVVVASSSSFDWSDAGIGAGLTFALLGFGAAILASRQMRRGRLTAV